MEITSQHPLVSVAVITYNSADYILETLESIKTQTYDNIELIVSDDCSTDNTLDICRKWIDANKSRFEDSRIVEAPVNTGQSGNYNRAFDACNGEWVKEIDGDDRLLPNCIEDFIEYTTNNPEAKYVFGKISLIGGDDASHEHFNSIFDYSFFSKYPEEQLHFLIFNRNCIPSPGSFYNREYIVNIGFRHDERIPFLEDWPKWITLLQKGVKFYFMDKYVADYRIGNGVSTSSNISPTYLRSLLLTDIYYRWPIWMADGTQESKDMIAKQVIDAEDEIIRLRNTHAYRLGKMLLKPITWLRKITR